jgi:cob(I)alamin adenosyltransferase
MTVYTKKGDKGITSLFDGRRVLKNSKIIEAIGTVDELNSYLGICIYSLSNQSKSKKKLADNRLKKEIQDIQRDLFEIGAILAGNKVTKLQSYKVTELQSYRVAKLQTRVKKFEKEIDRLEAVLPVQKNFLLPGGSGVSSRLFYARALARRVERALVGLRDTRCKVPDTIYSYVNRLSDYLFILARSKNIKKHKEVFWKASK